jgi:TetR/AcrR family transcriptional repressor of nem operon
MARPKEFEPEQVLGQVTELFWKKGYSATSIDDILEVTGIGRKSLYDTFGDKQALYLAALQHYGKLFGWRLKQLSRKESIREIIQAFFETVVDESVSDQDRKGCFMVNASLEMNQHSTEIAKRVNTGMDNTREAFYQILVSAQEAGELAMKHDPKKLACYFLNTYIGLRILARSKPERVLLESVVSIAISVLN